MFRNLTYGNSDADTANVEKSIAQGFIQCRDFTTVARSKIEMVHVEKFTKKRGRYALSLQTIGAGDLLKWNVLNGDPVTPVAEPGSIRKLNQS